MLLFMMCRNCSSACVKVTKAVVGSLLQVVQSCSSCHQTWKWSSQPMVGGYPKGNVSISAAILFSGSMPTKCVRVFKILKCACISTATFFRHQKLFLQPSIISLWTRQQNELFQKLKSKKLLLTGDGRCDSPGHSAKFGAYSVIEMSCQKVFDIQLISLASERDVTLLRCVTA